jgi:DNA polymerase elongation subunit (family B)
MFRLYEWQELLSQFRQKEFVTIKANDVFRITRMIYKDNYLIIFFTGYLSNGDTYQFYADLKCDLYSYRKCYAVHANIKCPNNCISYKTMVMPGLRGVHSDRINVIKYKKSRNNNDFEKYSLDNFLNDINRVHMQTKLKEGQYVKFCADFKCLYNRLKVDHIDINEYEKIFCVIDPDTLKREIIPVLACYDIETHSNGQNFSNPLVDHIISISLVIKRDVTYTKICFYYSKTNMDDMQKYKTRDDITTDIKVVKFNSELKMIKAFFEILPLLNMDCLLDYNGDKFDLPFILQRVRLLSNAYDAVVKIGRYDLNPVSLDTKELYDKFNNKIVTHFFTYYIHIDLYQFLSADSNINDVENFQLNTVAEHYLQMNKVDLPICEMLRLYNENCMEKIIEYNVQDSVLPIEIFLKIEIIDFVYTQCALLYLSTDDVLSNISHKVNVVYFYNSLNNTYRNDKGEILPDPYFFNKYDLNITSGRKRKLEDEEQTVDITQLGRTPIPIEDIPEDALKLCHHNEKCVYTGGKVLSPKPGFYKWVVTLDFNSLYPTIMMQEGICLSNLFLGGDGYVYLLKDREAINPKQLKTLSDLRTLYKRKRDQFSETSFQYNIYDKLQNSVKRIANSIYGYFGIFFKALANYTTKIGREKLMEAIEKIEAMSNDEEILNICGLSYVKFKVIYGDTDSSFIKVEFNENEISTNMSATIKLVIHQLLLRLNSGWVGYKMALENIMLSLILLKKKKYCYLNTENVLKYKGWLVKKDMPLFMRITFREVVDSYLKGHNVACGMKLLYELMIENYQNFGINGNYNKYSFSMSYNETPTGKSKSQVPATNRKKVVTIAKRCREILANSGTDFLPGNGDRIPYLLIDIEGAVTQKAYPLKLFDSSVHRISWLKHVGILCTFVNELLQIFADENIDIFIYYFNKICNVYMREQMYDIKFPVLKMTRIKENDEIIECQQFSLYKTKSKSILYTEKICPKCQKTC